MSNEAVIFAGLQITNGDFRVPIGISSFFGNVTGKKGPCPGAFSVSVLGTLVDFSELTTPGYAMIRNLDPTNFVEYGAWEPSTGKFYPIAEILPGEFYPLRLSRHLGSEYGTAGTGATGGGNYLMIRADTTACNVSVEANET